jgi:hypothetical protein
VSTQLGQQKQIFARQHLTCAAQQVQHHVHGMQRHALHFSHVQHSLLQHFAQQHFGSSNFGISKSIVGALQHLLHLQHCGILQHSLLQHSLLQHLLQQLGHDCSHEALHEALHALQLHDFWQPEQQVLHPCLH